MALSSKTGSVALNTSTGNQSVTGLGFTPKLIFFMSCPDTDSLVSPVANYQQSFGVFDGTNQWCLTAMSHNGLDTSVTGRRQDDTHVIVVPSSVATFTIDYSVAAVSLDSDGFTLNIDDAPAGAYLFHYLAIGGDDVVNVNVGNFNTAGASQSITGVGFQPNAMLFATGGFLDTDTLPGNSIAGSNISIGFDDGTNTVCNWNYMQDNVGTSNTTSYHATSWSIDFGLTSESHAGKISSFDADGFSLTYTADPSSIRVFYVALNVTSAICGEMNVPTSTGFYYNSGLGFLGSAGLFISHGSSDAGLSNTAELSVGFASTNLQRALTGARDIDNQGTTAAVHNTHASRIYEGITSGEKVDFESWQADGFILDIESVAATGSRLSYLIFGGTGGGGGGSGGGGANSTDSSFLFHTIAG